MVSILLNKTGINIEIWCISLLFTFKYSVVCRCNDECELWWKQLARFQINHSCRFIAFLRQTWNQWLIMKINRREDTTAFPILKQTFFHPFQSQKNLDLCKDWAQLEWNLSRCLAEPRLVWCCSLLDLEMKLDSGCWNLGVCQWVIKELIPN